MYIRCMWQGLALLFVAILPPVDTVARESVEVAELNYFYDEHGRLVFEQVIFYEESGRVRDWRLVKGDRQIIPSRDWEAKGHLSHWWDGDLERRVRAKSFQETHLQYDPELRDREILPKEERKELIKAPRKISGKGAGNGRRPF